METTPAIMVAEDSSPKRAWRQYFVITDERCVIVEMVPALLAGWKFHHVSVQGAYDWPSYRRDRIVAFKLASYHAPAMAPDLGEFRERLLAVAAAGELPDTRSR